MDKKNIKRLQAVKFIFEEEAMNVSWFANDE